MHVANREAVGMSVRKDSYAWFWVTLAVLAIIFTIVMVVIDMMQPKLTVRLGDGVFTARVAVTDAEREKGLSGVKNLSKNQAMLFVFPHNGTHGIWMKDMKIPIDVVWLDKNRKVVHIVHNMEPESYPTTERSRLPAKYVIELPAGTARERAIHIGAIASFDENSIVEGRPW